MCDIPGQFMQADMDDMIIFQITDPLSMLLAQVDPNKYENLSRKKGYQSYN